MDNTDDFAILRAELATLRQEVVKLRNGAPATPKASASLETTEPPQRNRRGFLRLAGAAAVGATAAAVAGSTQEAAAKSGAPVLIGNANSSTNANEPTRLDSPSPSTLDRNTFHVNNETNPLGLATEPPANLRIAGAFRVNGADDSNGYRTGVYARVTDLPANPGGTGVFASAGGVENPYVGTGTSIGVLSTAKAGGFGVVSSIPVGSASSIGVLSMTPDGYGVVSISNTGVALVAGGGGRIQQALRTLGAPTVGTYGAGEQIRDAAGDMYICIANGTPGTWRKVTAQAPGFSNSGGSINLLSTPIRLLDTRPGTAAPINNGFARVTGNTTLTIQITGTAVITPDGSLSVPAGAKGVIGNITIIRPDGEGYAQVWPSGAPPTTSTINYGPINASPAIANSFTCGLTTDGKVNILTYVTAHVLFDVAGFVF